MYQILGLLPQLPSTYLSTELFCTISQYESMQRLWVLQSQHQIILPSTSRSPYPSGRSLNWYTKQVIVNREESGSWPPLLSSTQETTSTSTREFAWGGGFSVLRCMTGTDSGQSYVHFTRAVWGFLCYVVISFPLVPLERSCCFMLPGPQGQFPSFCVGPGD